jgi:hypothetical protein
MAHFSNPGLRCKHFSVARFSALFRLTPLLYALLTRVTRGRFPFHLMFAA